MTKIPMFKDLREYLRFLENQGKLLRVKKEVDTRFEIAAGIRKISDTDGPALLFENIKDFPGWRVVGGLYATPKLMALALGLPMEASEESLLKRYLNCDEQRVTPKRVSTGPVKDIIIKGKDVDLTKLPVPIYGELDSGRFLSSGVEVARHPDTGNQNLSIHRRKILDKNRTALLAQGAQHLGMMIAAAEKKGVGLPVATVIGSEPSYTIASISKAPEGVDSTYIAGAFKGAPIEIVKCETIDVDVPANAEIVIEGITVPGERVNDGPFGEFPNNYISLFGDPFSQIPVVQITAITMRSDAIFQALLTGAPVTENHMLKNWTHRAFSYRAIRALADIKSMNLTRGGTFQYHLVVAINKTDEAQPKAILNTLLTLRHGPKLAIIVDDDINIFDPVDIEWALATRMNPGQDVVITPGTSGVAESTTMPTRPKMGIDATAPLKDKMWYQRVRIPGVEKVDYV